MDNKQDTNLTNTSLGHSFAAMFTDQTPTEEMIQLLKTMEKLTFLCHNYDLANEKQSNEVNSLLVEFDIKENPDNPFAVQNQILVLTDQTENLIKSKLQ